MARFSFRLQSYLNLKEKLEEQKKLDYGRALAKLETEKQKKLEMERIRDNNIISFKESIIKKIEPQTLQSYNNFIEIMKIKIRNQQTVIQNAEKNVELKRLALVEAIKDRKMLDTLKEKAHVEYMREEQINEQKIVDEIVSYQYNNR